MDPFDLLVTATRIGLLTCLGGALAWAGHQRAVVHHVWRQRLRHVRTDIRTFPYWMTAGTVAGLV
jgi:hypothetical protein